MLSPVRYLTVSPLRLNCRDYIRDRSATSNPDHALNVSSIRIEPSSDAYESKSGRARVSVTTHRSTISNFARNKSDLETAFEIPKPVTILAPTCDAQIDTYSICRTQVSPVFKAKIERRSRARSVLGRSWRNSREGAADCIQRSNLWLPLVTTAAWYPWRLLSQSYITISK